MKLLIKIVEIFNLFVDLLLGELVAFIAVDVIYCTFDFIKSFVTLAEEIVHI